MTKFRELFTACYIFMTFAGAFIALAELYNRGTFTGHSVSVLLIALVMWGIDMMVPKPEKPIVHTVKPKMIVVYKGNGWKDVDWWKEDII